MFWGSHSEAPTVCYGPKGKRSYATATSLVLPLDVFPIYMQASVIPIVGTLNKIQHMLR